MPVGKIYDYRFNKENKVEIDVVIDKAFAHFVKKDSRFWNISGINANINSSGMNVAVESLNAVVQGAVSFDSPSDSPQAVTNSNYILYSNLQAAKRGIEVEVTLPVSAGLQAGQTSVYLWWWASRFAFVFKNSWKQWRYFTRDIINWAKSG